MSTSKSRAQSTGQDPPREVGRLAVLDGTVSYHTADENHWRAARRNYPVTTGESFWTEPNAHAGIEVANNEIYLDSSTELGVASLNDKAIQLSLPQGSVFIELRSVPEHQSYEVDIARADVTLASLGSYEIIAGDTEHDSQITVFKGSAHVAGNGFAFDLPAGKTALLSGEQTITQKIEDAGQPDAFVAWVQAHEPHPTGTPPKVASRITGAADLAAYGHWARAERYGDVWYPDVPAGWTPYREGYWSWVAPWGWTWIDDEEWGFAPFHYGRWCLIDDRWAWVPVDESITEDVIPIYAPALVVFFETPGAIAWVPLGPDEVYVPNYPVSQTYFQQVNAGYVRNVTQFTSLTTNKTNAAQYVDARALTAVPPLAMVDSRPVRSAVLPISQTRLAAAKPVVHKDPIRPAAVTAGLSPSVARRFGIRAQPNGAPAGATPRAPGPPIRQTYRAPNARLSPRPALAQAAPLTRTPRPTSQRPQASQRPALARPGQMHHLPGSAVNSTTSSTAAKALPGAAASLGHHAARTTLDQPPAQTTAPPRQNGPAPRLAVHHPRAPVGQARKRTTAVPSPTHHMAPLPKTTIRRPSPRLALPRSHNAAPRLAAPRPHMPTRPVPSRIAAPSPPRHVAPPPRAMVGRTPPPRITAPAPHAALAPPHATVGQARSGPPARSAHAAPAAPPPHAPAPAARGRPQRPH